MRPWLAILAALFLSATTIAQTAPQTATTRAAILTFGEKDIDMVGLAVTAEAFRACIPMLKAEKVDTVVVRFQSGGGFYPEVEKFSDLFHNEFKKEFRLVAWVDEAISAAAMSAHSIEEICFTPKGNYGACTGFSGRLIQPKRGYMMQPLALGETLSARGDHHPQIMRAMQISSEADECEPLGIQPPFGALSATVVPARGEVLFFPDAKSGALVLNPKGGIHILTLNAEDALKIRFSKGTAATLDELEKVLGLAKVQWVGERTGGVPWPISKAERSLMDGRRNFAAAAKELRPLLANLPLHLSKAQTAAPADRTGLIADARIAMDRLKALISANPTLMLLNWGGEDEYQRWIEQIERVQKELSKLEPASAQPAIRPEAPHTPRAAVLTFGDEKYGDTVGIYETARSFHDCIPLLEQEKVDLVVIRVKCGGGLWVEVPRLADLFHDEFKRKFRTVAWIDSAISAGAMSVHSLEEIYFTPQGVYGGCSGGAHRGPGWQRPRRDDVLRIMDRISAMGDHHRQIMRAMMLPSKEFAEANGGEPPYGDLSATVEAGAGEVRFFEDTSGQIVLNPRGGVHCLTLDAGAARSVKFSRGTASTLDELAKAMGLPKVEWVGQKDPAAAWPICKAERHLLEFRKDARAGETEFHQACWRVTQELSDSKPVPDAKRSTRRNALDRSLRIIRDRIASNENWMLLQWVDTDEYTRWLADAHRRLADLSTETSPDGKTPAR